MMASLQSNAQCLVAFGRLVYSISQQFSEEECQAIVFIRLHKCREQYKDASTLNVLSKLEMCGVFSPSNPAGLIDIARDVNRADVVKQVKAFIKNQKSKTDKEKKSKGKTINQVEKTHELYNEEMTQLRPTVEVALSQAAVLKQQLDILQQTLVSKQRQTAAEANKEAGRAVKELTEYLGKVREALGESYISPQSSTSSCSSGEDTCKPPVQETCDDPAQTLASILNMAHKDKQQVIDCQRKPQSPPVSPYLGRDISGRHAQTLKRTAVALQTKVKKPMTPPATRHLQLPPKIPTKTPVEDYVTLSPDIDDGAPTTSGTGDSGYCGAEEWKQHMHHPPPFKADAEEHYYKSLHKDTIKDVVYEELQQQ